MIVEQQHFEYLVEQRGGLSNLRFHFEVWKHEYERSILRDFNHILPTLKPGIRSMLDVAGGLSGLGAAVNAHYNDKLLVAVLDGKANPPQMVKSYKPHNNATMTQQFLRLNGVSNQLFFAPDDPIDRTFDLLTSTQGWCFHIAPDEYLEKLEHCVHIETQIVLDVRKEKHDWKTELCEAFGDHVRCLHEAEKYERLWWDGVRP